MSALRLHAACPVCARVEPLRPDGTMLRHKTPPYYAAARWVRCEGEGRAPAPGAIDAWLDAEIAGAARVIDTALPAMRAEETVRHAKVLAEFDAREARMRERLAWATAKRAQRGGGAP